MSSTKHVAMRRLATPPGPLPGLLSFLILLMLMLLLFGCTQYEGGWDHYAGRVYTGPGWYDDIPPVTP
jgi:hypothetical protein